MQTETQKKGGEDKRRKLLFVLAVTMLRIPLAICFALVLIFADQTPVRLIICIILLALVELTDLFDGKLARRLGVVSELGATLDPYSDSLSRIIIYYALACEGIVLSLVPLIMALRDVTAGYCRIIITRHNESVAANWSGKIKAGFQGFGAPIMLLGTVYTKWTGEWTIPAGSAILILVTLWSVSGYASKAIALCKSDSILK